MKTRDKTQRTIKDFGQNWFYEIAGEMSKDTQYLPDGRHVNQKGSDLKRDLLFSYFTRNEIIPTLLTERSIGN